MRALQPGQRRTTVWGMALIRIGVTISTSRDGAEKAPGKQDTTATGIGQEIGLVAARYKRAGTQRISAIAGTGSWAPCPVRQVCTRDRTCRGGSPPIPSGPLLP